MYVGFIFVLKGIRNLGSTYYTLRVYGSETEPRYAARVHTKNLGTSMVVFILENPTLGTFPYPDLKNAYIY